MWATSEALLSKGDTAVPRERFVGKVCVVNGAASEIGRAIAACLESEGALVVGVDRNGHDVGRDIT
jgi:NAD(P)-dependent dehydrogenase (short-subunit alcohol dehydrogenase family)